MRVISPIQAAGYILTAIAVFFVLLPPQYFNSWFKYIFSWAFPLSIILVISTRGTGDWLVISKTDVVQLLGILFGIVTIIFIAVQWFWSKK